MAEDLIRYDILAQDALRGVVRKVLSEVARTGLPGEHHFYITVATNAAGVRVSTRLLAQYPEEMTIVVQHQYWDLVVTEHAFEIGLSFNGIPERLFVPFSAVKTFADPSVGFQLQFAVVPTAALPKAEEKPAIALVPATPAEKPSQTPMADADVAEAPSDEAAPAAGAAQVVSLDAFRKK
ncbi:MAG TPA: ClpXP protease specificity-enhancing factor SspB [Propylenella sp.]|jgi:hypothetical protein